MLITFAVDHSPLGLAHSPVNAFDVVSHLPKNTVSSVLCEFGVAREIRRKGLDIPLTIRLDGNECYLNGDWMDSPNWHLVVEPQTAMFVKPQAFIVNLLFGMPAESRSLEVFREVLAYALPNNIDVIVSPYVKGGPQERQAAVRMACEYGADIVVATGVESPDEVEPLLAQSFCPLWLGGGLFSAMNDDDYLSALKEIASTDVAGLLVGTRVWKHDDANVMLGRIKSALSLDLV